MFSGLKILAVIPARGGSKGVPRKNIRELAGEPLIVHTIRTAQNVKEIDALVVSTDDAEIASVAQSYGVQTIQRPAELASDEASTESALLHVIEHLESDSELFDIILVLEPTSPLRSRKTIQEAIKLCSGEGVQSVLAVKETYENVGFIKSGIYRPVVPDAPRRRQLRRPFYIESSTIYAARVSYLQRTGTLVCDDWYALVVPELEANDINTEADFRYIEFLLQNER